ncbi:MAG: hypothetical protein KDJ18_07005 [Hyphomicrobiaceae bacterium]|nr:hypothetical protein [Hyphomicrobiaceae bacterium]
MPFSAYVRVLVDLAETLHGWIAALTPLDRARRRRVARYAARIADTLSRASDALTALEHDVGDQNAARRAAREFGRIAGYVETMVGVLEHHLDGRKLAGVKRRLERLDAIAPRTDSVQSVSDHRIDRLHAAEGYFRALADGLET